MTNRPRLRLGKTLVPGLLAVGLFALMALIVLNTPFEPMADGGFEAESITAAIGYALFDLEALQQDAGVVGTEPFLAAFLLIAVALDAALDASLVLAKREESGEPVSPLSSTSPDDAGTGARPATDSSGFGGSEPTATDGGRSETAADERSNGGDRQ
ncbi:NADH-quinone oxidoreductase subunit J [Haloterrigena sp. SYSU A121-1]|uniref:NADH-quinone oxidoreductase subunit J n=1 Tax=Haloterrigena gelatinilytica TaxID=2741724 RepID=A0A8J8GLG5_9EURY|nr:NADH-quinone oxidoreductase subunit J [Haloterrigena gelatinilytica]NUB91368.1 NADH-quinone oxidoreductase subunit J [Haloterrigena gelatinilytica]